MPIQRFLGSTDASRQDHPRGQSNGLLDDDDDDNPRSCWQRPIVAIGGSENGVGVRGTKGASSADNGMGHAGTGLFGFRVHLLVVVVFGKKEDVAFLTAPMSGECAPT